MKYNRLKSDAVMLLSLIAVCLLIMFTVGCKETIIDTNVVKLIHGPNDQDYLNPGTKMLLRDGSEEYLLILGEGVSFECPAN